MSQEQLLLLGSRPGALRAAAKLGVELSLLHPRPLSGRDRRRAARAAAIDLAADPAELLSVAGALLGERRVDAVLAVTEAAVLPAARLRAAFGLAGNGVEASLRCADKLAMKRAARDAGIPCADWVEVGPETSAAGLLERLGRPVVLKPARSSGSRGLALARDEAAIGAVLRRCALAERFVEGREMSVESFVVGGEVLFENPTEYLVPLHANVVPAELAPDVWAAVRALNRSVVRAMGLERGIAHVELFLTAGGPVFGEIAARPPGGRLMHLLHRAYGFDPWEALLRIELGERPHFPSGPRGSAGAWMLHPGEGVVVGISGLDRVAQVPGVRAVHCRVRPGERVPRREGSGQDVGYIEALGRSRDEVAAALRRGYEALCIQLRRPREG